ncbi:hypothetical protein CCYA_CCYA01G0394 [Cyanidiococcus yangmingshanensis]|uniref:Uncharacterized protein n=1 Tax=Cyanidiococcus yangmingshanensis TaxID=2690220 RepID=A0A7J7IRD7_9RHOD|nr:hypothetical protein F1559_000921 [Cyanidiococcus yangmingshanensis]KAK4529537.1 hypothetical protein CCYA_CCYA01G0394 [Cyanidiococcus yangmingshanensis]
MRWLQPCGVLPARYGYLKISIEFVAPTKLESYQVQALIQAALRSLYGQVGSATLLVDILVWEPGTVQRRGVAGVHEAGFGLLRMEIESAAAVWAALTVLSTFDNKTCRVIVHEATPFLPALCRLPADADLS